MVRLRDDAALYTMEGIAGGLIMLLTIYLVLGTTMVFTTGDSHISDMRFKQEASDILRVIDTPKDLTGSLQPNQSDLERIVSTTDIPREFSNSFRAHLSNSSVAAKTTLISGNAIQIDVNVSYVTSTGLVIGYNLTPRSYPPGLLNQVPGVMVTHWVYYNGGTGGTSKPPNTPSSMQSGPQPLLVEVYLWKA